MSRTNLGNSPSDLAHFLTSLELHEPLDVVVETLATGVLGGRVISTPCRIVGFRIDVADSGDAAETITARLRRGVVGATGTPAAVTGSSISLTTSANIRQADRVPLSVDLNPGDRLDIELTSAGVNATDLIASVDIVRLFS